MRPCQTTGPTLRVDRRLGDTSLITFSSRNTFDDIIWNRCPSILQIYTSKDPVQTSTTALSNMHGSFHKSIAYVVLGETLVFQGLRFETRLFVGTGIFLMHLSSEISSILFHFISISEKIIPYLYSSIGASAVSPPW